MDNAKKPIRVLHIIGDSKFGGASLVVCEIIKMLQGHGLKVTLLATDRDTVEYAALGKIDVWQMKGIQRSVNPFIDIPIILRLASAIKEKYDVVHTHTSKGGAIGRIAAWLVGIPVIIHTVHGFAFHEFSSKFITTIYCMIERMLAKTCHYVIFVNNFDRIRAIENRIVPETKTITIYNGISQERLEVAKFSDRNEIISQLRLNPKTFLCVTVGRLTKQKGLQYLFRAMQIVSTQSPELNIHLAVVGDGPLRKHCEQWIKEYKVYNSVHLLGFQKQAIKWTSVADLFVLSSLWEGHSITLLEAMGCGKAIVATNIKGNRETITNGYNGILVKPADPETLAEAIIKVASDKELLVSLQRNAIKTFEENYTINRMLNNTWLVYQNLLCEKDLLNS